MQTILCTHLIKSADLNHHGTLYAGRMADEPVSTEDENLRTIAKELR